MLCLRMLRYLQYDCEKINTEDPGKKLSVYRLPADTEERRKSI